MSQRITIQIANKIATCMTALPIVCGNSDYLVDFIFDEEWNEHLVKTARFKVNDTYIDKVFEGNVCEIPIITNAKIVWIGVFAGDLSTSTPALVQCRPSILDGEEIPAPPREDVYAQIIELCEDAKRTAESIEERANNGEFKGEKGDRGPQGISGGKGDRGPAGEDGEDGYTPEKGIDYYTEEEKEELLEGLREELNIIAEDKALEIGEGKVDKVTTPFPWRRVYAIDETGAQDVVPLDNGWTAEEDLSEGGVVIRNENLSVFISSLPVEDTDAVNKAYVDMVVGDISSILTALHEGGIS